MGGGGGQGGDMSGMGSANMMPGSGAMNYSPQGGFGGMPAYGQLPGAIPSPNVGTNAMPGGAPIPKSFNPGDKFMPGAVNPAMHLNQAGTGGMGAGGSPMLANPMKSEQQIYNRIGRGMQPGALGLHLGQQLGSNAPNIERAIYDRMSHGMQKGQLGLGLGGGAQAIQQGVPTGVAPMPATGSPGSFVGGPTSKGQ